MRKLLSARLLLVVCFGLTGLGAEAQTVYRIVGPDGRVTFSDRAPDSSAKPAQNSAQPTTTTSAALPYELQQVASRFPVTLYTGNDCTPCINARNLLVNRGIPFTERTVTTSEDLQALQRLSGNSSLPFGTIGGQQLIGFSDVEWTQYLNAAGYPKQSQLPSNYRRPAATPLVAVKAAQPETIEAPAAKTPPLARQRPAPAPVMDGPTPNNPAGIRF